jgi:putative addiction module component (TIGR02574 family)
MSAPRVGLALEHPGRGFGYVRHMNAALWKEIAALPRDEQLELAEAIWEGVIADNDPPALSEAQRVELDRRLDEMACNPEASLTWDEVRARARCR